MSGIGVNIDVGELPEFSIDDDVIADWIEARLNDARNTFIQRVSRREAERGGAAYKRSKSTARRSRRQRWHVASAPGEYPATDTGQLVSSVWFQMLGDHEGLLYSDLKHAGLLTTGTKWMEPRQMLADALTEVLESRPNAEALAKAAVVTRVRR